PFVARRWPAAKKSERGSGFALAFQCGVCGGGTPLGGRPGRLTDWSFQFPSPPPLCFPSSPFPPRLAATPRRAPFSPSEESLSSPCDAWSAARFGRTEKVGGGA